MKQPSAALLRALPPGTVAIGGGLVVLGATTYGALAVAGRSVGPAAFAPLSVLWAAIFTLGSGFFGALEQQIARALATTPAPHLVPRALLERAGRAGAAMTAGLLVLLLITSPILTEVAFDGEPWLVAALAVSAAALCVEHGVRGLLSGTSRYSSYGAVLALGGIIRLGGCALLSAVGVQDVAPYAFVLAAAPLLAVLPFVTGHRTDPAATIDHQERDRSFSTSLAVLVGGIVLSLLVINGPALVVTALARPGEATLAGQVGTALLVARLPLFPFVAITAVLVPQLTAAARQGAGAFRRALLQALGIAVALGAAGAAVLLIGGRELVELLFGGDFDLPSLDLALLGVGTAAFMLASVSSAALVSAGRVRANASGWGAGVLVLALVTAATSSAGLLERTQAGYVSAAVAAAVLLSALQRAAPRAGSPRSGL